MSETRIELKNPPKIDAPDGQIEDVVAETDDEETA